MADQMCTVWKHFRHKMGDQSRVSLDYGSKHAPGHVSGSDVEW